MSNYVKATNFATKDTLPTGDSNKIVKGTEIDNEFNAIAGAISSKADLASPAFTGTPTAPTATSTANNTQLATTAFVKTAVTEANATPQTRTITAGAGLSGGGDLSADRTLSIASNSNGFGVRTISSSTPTGGSNGDIWYQV